MSLTRTSFTVAFAAGLLAGACGGGGYGGGSMPTSGTTSGTTSGSGAAADVVVTIAGMSFSPSSVTVQPGQTVVWKNTDGMAHTATQDDGVFDTGPIAAGAVSKPVTITGPGALRYHCTIHPGMVGTLNGTTSGGGGY